MNSITLYMLQYRLHGSAIMQGIHIKCATIQDINKELKENLHETISNLIITSKLKVPIVGVNRDTGSTNWHNIAERDNQRYAFGIPRWFCRFNFTSAISDVPFIYVSWIKFTLETATKSCFMGHISANEWNSGPFIRKSDDINPFCSIDYIMPSRFDFYLHLNINVSLISFSIFTFSIFNQFIDLLWLTKITMQSIRKSAS